MNEDDVALANFYRARAEHIRGLKIAAASENARARLESAAPYYDRLAERLAGRTLEDD